VNNRVVLFQPNGEQKSYMVQDIQYLLVGGCTGIVFDTMEHDQKIRIQTNLPFMFYIAQEDEEE
jgi:hypothetical protein